ncbi:MAG: TonB-dependent receptor [Pseudomonadota bacterium]
MRKPTNPNGYLGFKSALSLSVGFSALVAGTSFTAAAQEEVEDEVNRLNTITISATKREQTLQDVPVAVSVVDDATIEKAEILDLNDLQSVVPSLGIRTFQTSANATFTIRGFGNGSNNIGVEPSVGVFIDGVYRSRAAAQIGDLPDIQRVEVLRGPQSTLFGKNASAGVVSVVTRKPSDTFGGNVEASFGNFNLQRYKGYVSGPISDTVSFSLGGGLNQRDGTAEEITSGADVNERNRWNVRGQLMWEPTENQEWRVIVDADEIDEVCCIAANVIDNAANTAIIESLGGQIAQPGNPFSREIALNRLPENVVENRGISLHGDIEFDGFTLTTITAYRETDAFQNYDIDYSSADLASLLDDVALETFTQEIRLTSNGDGALDWMVGGFYFDEKVSRDSQLSYDSQFRDFLNVAGQIQLSGDPTNPAVIALITDAQAAGTLPDALAGLLEPSVNLPIGSVGVDGSGTVESVGQDDQAISLFGTADWHLTDRLTASFGINYTSNEKESRLNIQSSDALAAVDLAQAAYNAIIVGAAQGAIDITDPAQVGAFVSSPAYPTIQAVALNIASNFDTSNPAFDPANPATFAPGFSNPFAAFAGFQFQPPFVNVPNAVEDGITDDDQFTYSLRLAYDLTDNVNVYGSYATGWKSSSINLGRDSRPFPSDFIPSLDLATQQSVGQIVDPLTMAVVRAAPSSPIQDAGLSQPNLTTGTRFAEPEDSSVFEIGLKGAWDNFALNVAIFDQKIENFQGNVFLGTGFVLTNAEEQSATGLELDASWSPTENLTLNFAGTFIDPEFDSFPNGTSLDAAGNSSSIDQSGETPTGIPQVITSTSVLYNFDLTDNWGGFFRADWQYEEGTDFYPVSSPQPRALLDATGFTREINLFNASLGFESANGLGITLWGRNIFDDEYLTSTFPGVAQAGRFDGYPSQPQTYGVTVRKTF